MKTDISAVRIVADVDPDDWRDAKEWSKQLSVTNDYADLQPDQPNKTTVAVLVREAAKKYRDQQKEK